MALCFTVLGSGSSGNASLLEAGGFGLLVDAGLGPRQIASRLGGLGRSWDSIHAAVLTHTHGDHWKDRTLAQFVRRNIPFYCHREHAPALRRYSKCFCDLEAAGLVRPYDDRREFAFTADLICRPLALRHDDDPTFGFRIHSTCGKATALGYLADLGSWNVDLLHAVADVDLLALEFNHDVEMQYASGRSAYLIARILGEEGHLSNEQAAAFLRRLLALRKGRLQHVVQLHLSRDCNHPDLAREAALAVLRPLHDGVRLHTSAQHTPCPPIDVVPTAEPVVVRARKYFTIRAAQPVLPGLEAS